MKAKIGVIIVAYNRAQVLRACLSSIMKSEYPNYVVIVVDNASTDDTYNTVKSQFPSVVLVRSDKNLGYTGGNNLGIKYALQRKGCDSFLILNEDTVVPPNLLTELVDVMDKNPKIGLVNPTILDFETQHYVCNSYGKYNFYLGVGYKSLLNKNKPQTIDLLRGTCFLIKKQVVESIGLMDEDFFLYFDEADLSYRITKAGYVMVFSPEAKVYHQISHSFSGWANPVALYYSTRNELLFARKHLNFMIFWPLWIPRFILRIIHSLLVSGDIKHIKFMMRGIIDFAKCRFGRASFQI
jgi:GT2 family glycosyltransferase